MQQRGCCNLFNTCLHEIVQDGVGKKNNDKQNDITNAFVPRKLIHGIFSFTSQELKLKDKECERLSQVRNQLEQELEELTASLFEVSCN